MNRRTFILATVAAAVAAACSSEATADDTITVYQSPT
jgi:ABC-type glycerol-3-phosphate transport system substrate-binding protein